MTPMSLCKEWSVSTVNSSLAPVRSTFKYVSHVVINSILICVFNATESPSSWRNYHSYHSRF